MRNRNMFRGEGRGMGQRCGIRRRYAMNSEEFETRSMPTKQGRGRCQGFSTQVQRRRSGNMI